MRVPRWLLVWVIAFGVIAVAGAFFSYTFVRARATELDDVLDLPDPPQLGSHSSSVPTATIVPAAMGAVVITEEPAQTDAMLPLATEAAEADVTPEAVVASAEGATVDGVAISPWNDPRRVTVLLLGIDQREGEEGTFPTDTIILFSVDPAGKTAAILSIPRDLWVTYPGLSQKGKINAANIVGDSVNYPGGGGPALAMKTVTAETGVTIDYYVLINFDVFTTLIDAIGPVEVCPEAPIDDDQYPDGSYGVISIHFDAGCQELESERLLQYARTRHGDSDINRASRQQEVIMAVRDKVLTLGGILDLLPVATDLWDAMQKNVRTNMSFADMLSLGLTAESIPPENIRQGQISFDDVQTGVSPEGEDILLPIATDIGILIQDLFRPAGAPSIRGE
ncbi:LCP family protein [Aggregatilinea lenta]|uniref:LCP family protein n=1 Tax=Aggregatilinea lenta TaxID=913108 RepID=UPI000E5A34C4|nr:LCP family protein [Aggregatilinea lenta]